MKIVMIVNTDLPVGLVANAAAVLGISLGNENKKILGPDCVDGSDRVHKGITHVSIPILGADTRELKTIYAQSILDHQIEVIDFNQIAQSCRDYSDYMCRLANAAADTIDYSGLCLSGPKKPIESITGALRLYR